ncbi:MAG: hypothetical protein IJ233_09620, partial [Pyramidobacter sp.]|nr:hypothetical protein [Pyramidobacter sp.]
PKGSHLFEIFPLKLFYYNTVQRHENITTPRPFAQAWRALEAHKTVLSAHRKTGAQGKVPRSCRVSNRFRYFL